MTAQPVVLDSVTRVERHLAVDAASAAIQQAGGWIEDVHFFSNLSVTLRAMMPAATLAGLSAALDAAGIGLSSPPTVTDGADETPVSLRITFLHEEPDLRRKVPSVPG
jgi:hypothetical protein